MSDPNDPTRAYRQPADLRHAEAIIDSMMRGCSHAMGVLMAARMELREKAARQESAQAGPQPPNGAVVQPQSPGRVATGETRRPS